MGVFRSGQKPISQMIAFKLAKVFKDTGGQDALKLIARNAEHVAAIGGDLLLANLDEEYWRARVVEALIHSDRFQLCRCLIVIHLNSPTLQDVSKIDR
jgi:hypothetical protein